jgi:CheY-like chemotaxis protein
MNLAINARDAMPRGGRLTIDVGSLVVDRSHIAGQMAEGRYVTLSVSDTGIGMTKETREHIFEPFFTTKEAGKGTGLGLSTVYGIVSQSGGYIWVDSEPDRGSVFKVHLPFVEDVGASNDPLEPETPSGGSETILLVEDEDAVRDVARRILNHYGYRILEARDGAHALEVIAEFGGPIDLVITDVVMPRMGGRELVQRVTELRGPTPALYISGYTNDEILRRSALDPGGLRVLQKPFTPSGLAAAAREAIAMHRALA